MRVLMVLAGVLPVLAGCGTSEEAADANAAAANYRPPSVTSRLDYGGQIERRFHRLDKNIDDKLSEDELPERMRRVLMRGDTNGDGSLSSDEWGALMLARFDRQDLNKDGSVTTEERVAARQSRRDARSGDQAAR
ncbi:EF-hand domain-containing protein [Sphingomonas radiodurans]|uniref:hypothetical protein n=1 Tax=Sphingomonas radiodurans TaxID=2890321 RepID=UPI001E55AB0D|nr:hypothetical protein [Sphingomonas radiodurans]WBH17669.1 hypothetical protein LLW23_06085 [Sphingomonas radiodurans]